MNTRLMAMSLALAALALLPDKSYSQPFSGPPAVTTRQVRPNGAIYERIMVHGQALEGNLEGDSPDRNVSVYLPPSYATARWRRYPVLYVLRGFTDSDGGWFGLTPNFVNLPDAADRAFASGANEMIIVMPDAFTRFAGSMYGSSVTTGDWETFIARDLVSYIDTHYRTIPLRASRGLAGHSMGGYGTLRIGMKASRTFSSLYAMSPCCLPPPTLTPNPLFQLQAALVQTDADFAAANVVVKAIDAGDRDHPIVDSTQDLDQTLQGYGITHTAEVYPGDHISAIGERLETHVLPFFSTHLRSR